VHSSPEELLGRSAYARFVLRLYRDTVKMTEQRYRQVDFIIIVLGTILRMVTAILYPEVHWADEHYQTLEPAFRMVYGFGVQAWEWQMGARNYFVPSLYSPVIFVMKFLGIDGGLIPIISCRLLNVLAGVIMLFQIWRFIELFSVSRLTQLFGLATLSLSGSMVAWGPTTLNDNWAMIFTWIAIPGILIGLKRGRQSELWWIGLGFLFGLSFFAKFQTIVLATAFFGALFFSRNRLVYWCALGYGISILTYGLLDWVTWGRPFQSIIVNVQVNLSGFAEEHGSMPFWGYLRLLWDHGDRPLLVAVMIGATLVIVRNFKKLSGQFAIVLGATLSYFLFCSAIKHKELRFILPSLPAFYILGVLGFEKIFQRIRVPVPLAISLLLTASITTWIFEYNPSRFYILDLTRVSNAVFQDSRKSGRSISCVGFIGHHHIWSRGKMIYGRDVELKQVDEKAQSTDCNYLIVGWWIDRNQEILKKFEAFYSDHKKNRAMVRVAL
jgi:Alg9-like mannosyltransferase family